MTDDSTPNILADEQATPKTFDELLAVHDRYLYIEDPNYLRTLLALWITSKFDHNDPIWLLIRGAPSDLKSEQIKTLLSPSNTVFLSSLNSRSLISMANPKEKNRWKYDLVPRLNNKLTIISDFSTILSLDDKERNLIFAQFRDLYDGRIQRATGTGVNTDYKNLRITMGIATTSAIDNYQNEQTILGSRHLTYGVDTQETEQILSCIDDDENSNKMRDKLNQVTTLFLESITINEDVKVSDDYLPRIHKLAEFLALLRCGVMTDRYTREVSDIPNPEKPARIYKMMRTLWKGLKNVPDTSDETAYEILKKITWDSSTRTRIAIVSELINDPNTTTITRLANKMQIGMNTVKANLNILWALNLAIKEHKKTETGQEYDLWTASPKLRELVNGIGGLWKRPPLRRQGTYYNINLPPLTPSHTNLGKGGLSDCERLETPFDGSCEVCADHRWIEFKIEGRYACRGCYDEYKTESVNGGQ